MPRRRPRLLFASFAVLSLGFGACTDGSPRDINSPEAGADYGVHPREVHPDTSAAGADGAAGQGTAGAGGAAGQGTAGAGGASGATGAAGQTLDAASDVAATDAAAG